MQKSHHRGLHCVDGLQLYQEALGSRTLASYSYTSRNNYLSALDYGNGDSVQYTYDQQGRVTQQTYEDGDTVSYKYDNSGALACVTDSATGRTTTYYYDFTDRLMKYVETGSGYSHSARYEYDTVNNLTRLVETINGVAHTTSYAYDMDNRVTQITTDGITKTYTYDAYGRISQQVTTSGGAAVLTETYTYTTASNGQLSAQVATYRTQSALYDVTYAYTYDDNGNILSVSDGTNTTSYAYDSANQLIRENNQAANKTYTWTYDNAGNILSKSTYAYTTGELGSASYATGYTYGDSAWGDLLTEYNDRVITYDAIGNPTRDHFDNRYTWKHGRQLATYKEDGNESEDIFHFVYNADGLRVKAYNAYTTYSYIYNGSALVQMEVSNTSTGAVSDTLSFTYDAEGSPQTVTYNGTVYFYATNLQGDVIAILDNTGTAVVSYSYDAWGRHTSGDYGTGTLASTLGKYNPLRYRGYIYDIESGLYYLQSRYYNPQIGRFINADAFASTGQGVLGSNMFAYCLNNPVNFYDSDGKDAVWIQESDSASGFGHSGLLIQDENGEWWYFYWGATTGEKGFWGMLSCKNTCLVVKVEVSDEDLFTVSGVREVLANSNDKMVASRAELVTDVCYFEGDYTETLSYVNVIKKQNKKYKLLFRNCVQQSWDAMAKSNNRFKENSCVVIPNIAFIEAEFFAIASDEEYKRYCWANSHFQ
ncbi:MAG: RHS repeat-associated core domain-containing protein [Faecousia sp.]